MSYLTVIIYVLARHHVSAEAHTHELKILAIRKWVQRDLSNDDRVRCVRSTDTQS